MASLDLIHKKRIRTRVCGLIINENRILLIKHNIKGNIVYAPPGGGVEFNERLEEALQREVLEETQIIVKKASFRFITEYIKSPIHAIEIFYSIDNWEGSAVKGLNQISLDNFMIEDLQWLSIEEINQIKKEELHHIFHNCNNLRDIFAFSGYIPPTTI